MRTNQSNYYMSNEAFADLKAAIEDALAFERGERPNLKVTRIQAPQSEGDVTEGHCEDS